MSMSRIPHDVTLDILPKLPVKTLVRFMSVSTLWRSVISDPVFTVNHFKRMCRDPKISTWKILLSTASHIHCLDDNAWSVGDKSAVVKLDFPSKRPDSVVKIVGSCNGLVCVALDECKSFFVWNPSTGECRRLPDPGITSNGQFYCHGFGCDITSGDFKVFIACQTDLTLNGIGAEIFSLRRNLWTRFNNLPYPANHIVLSDLPSGVFVNESLHWQAKWSEQRAFHVIIAFSLASERFSKLALPEFAYESDFYCNTLGVVAGCLSLTCLNCTDNVSDAVELWIMKQYGMNQSWVRYLRISYSLFDYIFNFMPVFISRGDKGIIMINDGNELIKCHPQRSALQRLKISRGRNECEAIAYVESLLSPNVNYGN